MKTGEVADRLHVAENTIRNWARRFADFLSDEGAGKPAGATREFAEADLYVLATIAELRDKGLTYEQVRSDLARNYRATRLPEKPDADVEAARRRVDLVPTQEVELWMDRLQSLRAEMERMTALYQAEVERLVSERDAKAQEAKEERQARIEAEKEAARLLGEVQRQQQLSEQLQEAQARLMALQFLAGDNYRLQEELAYVRWLLEEEKQRKRGLFGR